MKEMGLVFELIEPKRGSHWVLECNGRSYTLALHNGPKSELSDIYLKGLCRTFKIDESELRKHL